jgi:metal-responsive CopG/Arc/MetJ family transcriptional regulator
MPNANRPAVKTSVLLDKDLLEEIDRFNPFPTRKTFLDQACRSYLKQLRRNWIDEKLAAAVAESASEDAVINEQWEEITLETWE